jgi:hypothetical protein
MDSMRNPPRPVKQRRLESFTSDSLFDKDSGLSEGVEHTELTLPLLDADHCNETIVMETSTAITNAKKNSTMASGTRGSSVPCFSTTGRAKSLQHVLKNVLKCDLTSPLYLSVLQHFGGDEDIRNLPTSGLDSGSSWLGGVNGILMQQEPDSPKQDYWNRRAIASLANTLITVMEPVPTPLLSSMPLLQL